MVENSIWHWLPSCVLGVQGLAHHVDVGLLPYLTGREYTELKIATAKDHIFSTFFMDDIVSKFKASMSRGLTSSWQRLCPCTAPSWWRIVETRSDIAKKDVR